MNKREYWKLSEKERKAQDIIDAKETEPKERYYLWDYCKSYGWRQAGTLEGYGSLKELKKDHSYIFNLKDNTPQRILKAVIIKEVEPE